MAARRGVTWAKVRKTARALPGVEEGTSHGTPAFRLRGKFLFRLREDNESLAVKCGFEERDLRLRANPRAFFVTDHYRGHPTVLVRLAAVTETELEEILAEAWRRAAPGRMVAEYDAGR